MQFSVMLNQGVSWLKLVTEFLNGQNIWSVINWGIDYIELLGVTLKINFYLTL